MLNQTQKPLIGIPTRINYNDDSFYLRRYYADAIYSAGGIPVYLPLIPEVDYIEAIANNLDGVVLSGNNSDVDPLRYGQGPHIKLGTVSDERDETDGFGSLALFVDDDGSAAGLLLLLLLPLPAIASSS